MSWVNAMLGIVCVQLAFNLPCWTRFYLPDEDPSLLFWSLEQEETTELWHGKEAAQIPGSTLSPSPSPL